MDFSTHLYISDPKSLRLLVPRSPVKSAEVETAREAYQQFLISQRQLDLEEMEEEQQVLFERVNRKENENESGEKEEHVDVSVDDL